MQRFEPYSARFFLGSDPHSPRSSNQRKWIVADNFAWSVNLQLNRIVGERPNGSKLICNPQDDSGGIGSVSDQGGVVGNKDEF